MWLRPANRTLIFVGLSAVLFGLGFVQSGATPGPSSSTDATAAAPKVVLSAERNSSQGNPAVDPAAPRKDSMVRVAVTVLDKKDHFVSDLAKEEFNLYVDKKEVPIQYFARETGDPLTVGLLLDVSGSRANRFPGSEQRYATQFFRDIMHKGDFGLVASFASEPHLLCDLASDVEQLGSAVLDAFQKKPHGGSALYDSVYWVCNEKLRSRNGAKALLIVTDADDNSSKKTHSQASEAAIRADTAIYFLYVTRSSPEGMFRTRGSEERENWLARLLAKDTGGGVILVMNEQEMASGFLQIAAVIRKRYWLGFAPSWPVSRGAFHTIRVETTRKNLTLLARKGYYEQQD